MEDIDAPTVQHLQHQQEQHQKQHQLRQQQLQHQQQNQVIFIADETEDFGVQNYRPLNRGQKLRPRTIEPSGVYVGPERPSLWAMHSIEETSKVCRL